MGSRRRLIFDLPASVGLSTFTLYDGLSRLTLPGPESVNTMASRWGTVNVVGNWDESENPILGRRTVSESSQTSMRTQGR